MGQAIAFGGLPLLSQTTKNDRLRHPSVLLDHVGDLGPAHPIDFANLAADLGGELFRLLVFVQIEFHFQVEVNARHQPDDTIEETLGTTCSICGSRRARRYCPGVRNEICAPCCGSEREVTITCPFDCEFLRQARKHEQPPRPDPKQLPNPDVKITEEFLEQNQGLLYRASLEVAKAALSTPGAVDMDVREALDALIRTLKTRDSGLYYETRPANPVAGAIQQKIQGGIEEFRKAAAKETGVHAIRDRDVLGVLVFLQRLELQENNGRRRSRAYVDYIRQLVAPGAAAESAERLIQ